MKKSAISLVALIAVSTFACGGASDAPAAMQGPDGGVAPMPSGSSNPSLPDGGSVLPGQNPRPADGGGPPPVEPPPPTKPNEITEQFGVFVSTVGQANASGTRAAPLASIEAAIQRAKNENKNKVFVCEGSYAEALTLADGVSIEGRLDCATADWKLDPSKHVDLASPSSPAIRATNITSATRIDGFRVTAPDATEPSESSIAVIAVDSNGLTFAGGSLTAGSAMKGADGTGGEALTASFVLNSPMVPPAPCMAGAFDRDRCNASDRVGLPRGPQPGGSVQCMGQDGRVVMSGTGGRGGVSGVYQYFGGWQSGTIGSPPATGGSSGSGSSSPGASGANGATGAFSESGFTSGDGTVGVRGDVGRGGSGAIGRQPDGMGPHNEFYWGYAGAGGGAGGCPGMPGTAGKGGGASVALLAFRSPVRLETMTVVAAAGGAGGQANFGSLPTAGQRVPGVLDGDFFGPASGETGGVSGWSGGGSGGPSIAVAFTSGAPIVVTSTLTPGAAGAGSAEMRRIAFGAETVIPASPAGVSLATQAF